MTFRLVLTDGSEMRYENSELKSMEEFVELLNSGDRHLPKSNIKPEEISYAKMV